MGHRVRGDDARWGAFARVATDSNFKQPTPSLRTNGSRECAPDEAKQSIEPQRRKEWIASSHPPSPARAVGEEALASLPPLLPSPREAAGRGRGWGVPQQTRCLRSKPIDPPPRPLPTTRKGAWREGRLPRMTSRSRRAFSREFCSKPPALCHQRAQGMPGARCARSPRVQG
jgi:hypothetical protein